MELKDLEIHLLMALKDVFLYNLDRNFDELFRDVEIENSTDAAICAVEAPTTQEIVLDAEVMEGSDREAHAGSGCCQIRPAIQQDDTLGEMQIKLLTSEIGHQMPQGSNSSIHHPTGPLNIDLAYTEGRVSNH